MQQDVRLQFNFFLPSEGANQYHSDSRAHSADKGVQWKTIEEEKKQVARRIKEQHTKYMMDPMEHTGDLDKPSSAFKEAERKWDEQLSEDK